MNSELDKPPKLFLYNLLFPTPGQLVPFPETAAGSNI